MTDKKWYVIYTKSRAEKKVRDQLLEKEIECFLPLQKTMRQWSDRKKFVEVPLFNSYVFVRISDNESTEVCKTLGVVSFISFNGQKACVPDLVITNLKLIVNGQVPVDLTTESFHPGQYVEIDRGALKELRGFLVNYHGKHKVLIRVEIINQNLLIEVPVAFLKKAYKKSA